MHNIIHRGNSTLVKIGNHEVLIPNELLNDFAPLAIMSGVPNHNIWNILACFLEAGKEIGKEELRQQLRPLVGDICRNTDTVMSAMREIEENFKQ